jgi:hypothetical protein
VVVAEGPWRSMDDLEIVVAEYIDWFNHQRGLSGQLKKYWRIPRHIKVAVRTRLDWRRRALVEP